MTNGVAVVTGAAGAIGSAVATLFLERHFRVVGIDLVEATVALSDEYRHVVADVGDAEELARAAETFRPDGRVDHLVGVAGGAVAGEPAITDLCDLDVAVFRQSLEANLVSQFLTAKTFLPLMRRNGSDGSNRSITLISSINALVGMDMPAYSSAKAGLLAFMRVLANTLGHEGIRVNAVIPGTVPTPRTRQLWADDRDHFDRLAATAALCRLVEPGDVAAAVVALSADLKAVTGHALVVDAGQTSTRSY